MKHDFIVSRKQLKSKSLDTQNWNAKLDLFLKSKVYAYKPKTFDKI